MGISFGVDGQEAYIYAIAVPRHYAERAPKIRSDADWRNLVRIPGDLAVLHLAEPIDGIDFPELADEPPEPGEELALWTAGGFGTATVAPWGFDFDGEEAEGVDDVNIVTLGPNSGFEGAKGSAYFERGDSGGPTFATRGERQVLVGVHSAASPIEGALNYDVRVDAYRDWILEQIEKPPTHLLEQGVYFGSAGKADTADSVEPWPAGCALSGRGAPGGFWPLLALVLVVRRRRSRRLLTR
jgi:MYXO-CTERM domain-containing protein